MKLHTWQRISVLVLFILILTFTGWIVKASSLLAPTPPTPPVQGCNTATGTGSNFKTCAFYVVASISTPPSSNDAGQKPECNYTIGDPEIYFGRCNSIPTAAIASGFRFQNVSIPIPAGQSVLASYIEFTTDGDYGNLITTNIYGQAPAPTPRHFQAPIPAMLMLELQLVLLFNRPSNGELNQLLKYIIWAIHGCGPILAGRRILHPF